MGEPDYPPEPLEDPGHVLSEEDWAQTEKLQAEYEIEHTAPPEEG